MEGASSPETAHCSNINSRSSSSRATSSSKPLISCHTPPKASYLNPGDRIVPWQTLRFRYQKPNPPAKQTVVTSAVKKKQIKKETSKTVVVESKKKHAKPKKESSKRGSSKDGHQKSKQKGNSPRPATAASSVEGSISRSADHMTSDDPGHFKCHISALPQCCLLRIFSYLPLGDLLRAGFTCRVWHRLSLDKTLWRYVALENTYISSWKTAAQVFQKQGTLALDFCNTANDEKMSQVSMHYIPHRLPDLQCLRFGRVLHTIVLMAVQHFSKLRVLEVCWLTDGRDSWPYIYFELGRLSKLTHLRQLKIRSVTAIEQPSFRFTNGLANLKKLKHLQKLSVTSLREIEPSQYLFLTELPELMELEIGDCRNWRLETYEMLGRLTNLRSLRLENGGCWCNQECSPLCTCNISDALRKLTELEKLELIMYVMPVDINPALQCLIKLRSLTFWPVVCLHGLWRESPQPRAPQLIQTNSDMCQALGTLRHLRQLTWGVPIINVCSTSLKMDYSYSMIMERALKSSAVLALSETLAKQLPDTAVNILIVPVVMSKNVCNFTFNSLDLDDDSSGWSSDTDYSETDVSDSDMDHDS